MGVLGGGMAVFNLLREVNLGAIRREADQPFTLYVLGPADPATALAEALSAAPGKRGVHPWLRVVPLPPGDGPDGLVAATRETGFAVGIVLLEGLEPDPAARSATSRLRALRIPSLTVAHDDGTHVGAATARPGETVRVVWTPAMAPAERLAALAPVLFERLPADDGARVALGRQLPVLRPAVIASLIEATSRTNALYAASTGLAEWVPILNLPLNAADVVVLTKNQLLMAYKIALAAGKSGQPRDVIGEIVSVLGGGLLFRQIARELIGLIPVVGIVPKVAVAYAGTRFIGAATQKWAVEGRRLEGPEMRAMLTDASAGARHLAESIVDRARGRHGGDEGDVIDVEPHVTPSSERHPPVV